MFLSVTVYCVHVNVLPLLQWLFRLSISLCLQIEQITQNVVKYSQICADGCGTVVLPRDALNCAPMLW